MGWLWCYRFWMHAPVGGLNAWLLFVVPHIGWALLLTFLVYEVWQCFRIEDEAQKDIIGHMGGLVIGGMALSLL